MGQPVVDKESGGGGSGFSRCWKYWRQNIETASKTHKYVLLITLIVGAVLQALSSFVNLQLSLGNLGTTISKVVELTSIVLCAVVGLLWLPFQRHEAQEKILREEKKRLEAENQSLFEHIHKLTDEQDKAARKDFDKLLGKHVLGNCLIELQNRLTDIQALNFVSFEDAVAAKENETTYALVQSIAEKLSKTLAGDASALFLTTKVQPLPSPRPDEFVLRKERLKMAHVNYLEAHLAQLRTIIEKQI